MRSRLSRDELVDLVRRIMMAEGSEEDLDEWQSVLEENVPHPAVSDLIFYPDRDMTAEEIVDRALAYQAIPLPGEVQEPSKDVDTKRAFKIT